MEQTLEKWSLDKHYKSIHALGENSSKEESLTPIIIVNQMVETILQTVDITIVKNPNFKVLDPACGTGSFLIAWYEVLSKYHSHKHIINNMLWGFETNFSYFRANNKYYQFKNVYKESFLETNKLDNMKFDVIVGNPPYKAGMHLDFVNISFDKLTSGGILSIIHPSQPFLNNKPTKKQKREIQVLKTINENTSKLKLVNGNKLFDNINIYVPLSITTIVKDGLISNTEVIRDYMGFENKESLENIESLTIHGNSKLANSIKDKILKKSKSMVVEHLSPTKVDNKYYLNFNIIGGNISSNWNLKDFYCPFYKAYENDPDKHILDFPKNSNSIQFNSYEEALNFFNYMKSKFSRFCISLCKINQHFDRGETSYLPYLDPNQEWDDNKCFDYFNLNKKEREFIKTYIKDWYEIDFN